MPEFTSQFTIFRLTEEEEVYGILPAGTSREEAELVIETLNKTERPGFFHYEEVRVLSLDNLI